NPRGVLLPEPIDSSTQLLDASAAFTGENHRFSFAYHGSIFRNNISAVTWQNPYSNTPWVGGSSGLPADFRVPFGQIGVAPDNQFHQLAANGSFDFSSTTRLSLAGTRGRMTQNEAFLPYTINPGLASVGLPRNSLGGVIETTFLNAKLSMRPVRNLSVNATLRFEDRDNKTPLSEYIYVGGDIQLQPQPGSNTDRVRTNLPRSRRQEQFTLDADYRIASAIGIKAGYDHEIVKRTFAEVERATENTYRLELRHTSANAWTANASIAILERRGTNYLYNLPYLGSYTSPAFISGLTAANGCTVPMDCVRTRPLQNKFFMADRNRGRARINFGFTPDAAWSLQTRLDVNRDRFPNTTYGVIDTNSWSASGDIAYIHSEDLTATLFTTFENQRSRERSRQIVNSDPAVRSGAESDWLNDFADKAFSIGFAARYTGLFGGRLELNADVIAVRGRSPISTSVGSAVTAAQNPAAPLPDLRVRSDNINLAARYKLDPASTLRLNYFYRRLNSADWAYEQVGATTLALVIGTNETPPQYAIHGVGVSYIRTFR
ncbi:MAG: MtrB/PioB family decaheme-associated outer membrane protein, partial [Usitatibacteraceae bacterium]